MSFQVNIAVEHDLERSLIQAHGEVIHIITDLERRTFSIEETQLKEAVGAYFERQPDDVYLHNPTPWDDLYTKYSWTQVHVHLRPIRAELQGVTSTVEIVNKQTFINDSQKVGFYDCAISSEVSDTIETNWSQTKELSFDQSINYGTKVFGGETTLSVSNSFQHGASKSRTVTLGQTSGVQVELQPGESVRAVLSSSRGELTFKVTFEAWLSGVVATHYDPTHKDHYFWALDVNGVRQAKNLPARFEIVNEIKVRVFSNGTITLEELAGNRRIAMKTGVERQAWSGENAAVPDMSEIFAESKGKGTAGQDAQGRRNKFDDESNGKGTAGQDAQGRRNKFEDESHGKGTAGQDAQGRRNRLEDESHGKGTAGQDAQGRRNKFEDESHGKGTAGQDAQGRRNKFEDESDGKGTAGQDAQGRRNRLEDESHGKGTAGQDAQGRRNRLEDESHGKGTAGQDAQGRRNRLAEESTEGSGE